MTDALGSSRLPFDALVVGAGASGALAALALAREGLRVAMAGPPTPAPPGRTVALFDPAKQALTALGVWEALEGQTAPLRVMRIVDDTGSLFRAPPVDFRSSEIGLDAFGDNIALGPLTEALDAGARAAGVTTFAEMVDDPRFDAETASVRRPDGSRIHSRLVVAADGRGSPLRRAAGVAARVSPYGQDAITCVFVHTAPHDDASTEFHTRGGPFTLVPMPPSADGRPRSSLVWLTREAEADRLAALDDPAFSRAAEKQSHSLLGRLTLEGRRGRFPMATLSVSSLVARRLALVGEAAHVFPPIGAQGLNLGVRDAAHLAEACGEAWARGEDVGGERTLQRYSALRRSDVSSRTAGVDLLNRAARCGAPRCARD
jgi:2-octaprenyl-6-methoxyphenol hydroxylase